MDYLKSQVKPLIYQCEESDISKMYAFLATDYDISNLAEKIYAMKNAKVNLMNLRKISCAKR